MAETTAKSTGAKSEFWFNDGTTLYRAREVKTFGHPGFEIEQLDATSLESTAKEFIPGDVEFQEFDVTIYFRPGSDTDSKLQAWAVAQTERAIKLNRAVRGVLTQSYDGNAIAVSYLPSDADRGEVGTAVVRVKPTGYFTTSAYVAPGG
jgi:hypothetical protein